MIRLMILAGTLLLIAGGPAWALDSDGDGVEDSEDNCTLVANAGSLICDSDLDGYGNACDADYDDNGNVNMADFGLFQDNFGNAGETDHDCNGFTTIGDFGQMSNMFGTAPGPSGLSCAGTPSCVSGPGLGDLTVAPSLVEPWHGSSSPVKYPNPAALGFPYDYTNGTYDVSTEAGRADLYTDTGVDCRLDSDDPAGPIADFDPADNTTTDDTLFARCVANIPNLTEQTAITIDWGGAVVNLLASYLPHGFVLPFWDPWIHHTNVVFECNPTQPQGACIGITGRREMWAGWPNWMGATGAAGFSYPIDVLGPTDTKGETLLTVAPSSLSQVDVDKDVVVVWGDSRTGYSADHNVPYWQSHVSCVDGSNATCGTDQVRLARPIPDTFVNPKISAVGGLTTEHAAVQGLKFSDMTIRWNTAPASKGGLILVVQGANRFEMTGVTLGGGYADIMGASLMSQSWIHKNVFLDLTENNGGTKSSLWLYNVSDNIIENNIFAETNRGITFGEKDRGSAMLNVVAYNYFPDAQVIGCKTVPTSGAIGRAIFFHGEGESMNLVEGNDINCPIHSDAFFGCKGPNQVMYRNRAPACTKLPGASGFRACGWTSHDDTGQWTSDLCFDKYVLIGNSSAYSFSGTTNGIDSGMSNSHISYNRTSDAHGAVDGMPGCRLTPNGYGLDNSGKCTFQGGNDSTYLTYENQVFDQDTVPTGWDTLDIPTSFYLSSEPDWWNDDVDGALCEWDHDGIGSFGDDFSGDLCKLPAQVRCEAGGYGSC